MKKLNREGALKIASVCAVLLLAVIIALNIIIGQEEPAANAVLHETGIVYSPRDGLNTKAKQAFVYDVNAREYLLLKGQDEVVYPASTTKLLTALLALEYLSPDEVIVCGDEVGFIKSGSSIAYIKPGMSLTVEMLIEGMLIPSGNDAAYAIAAAAGRRIADDETLSTREAVDRFVEEMNAYADKIGLCGSKFSCPDGYYDRTEHYSTIEDMAIISSLACKNELIKKYAKIDEAFVVYESGESNTWVNTNVCLDKDSEYYSPYITGLKTGSLDGYYNIICTAEQENELYVIGIFGLKSKESRYEEAQKLASQLLGFPA